MGKRMNERPARPSTTAGPTVASTSDTTPDSHPCPPAEAQDGVAVMTAIPGSSTASMSDPHPPIAADEVRSLTVELGVATSSGYAVRGLRDLTSHEARNLKDLAEGMGQLGNVMANGRPVRSARDVLTWLSERVDVLRKDQASEQE